MASLTSITACWGISPTAVVCLLPLPPHSFCQVTLLTDGRPGKC